MQCVSGFNLVPVTQAVKSILDKRIFIGCEHICYPMGYLRTFVSDDLKSNCRAIETSASL